MVKNVKHIKGFLSCSILVCFLLMSLGLSAQIGVNVYDEIVYRHLDTLAAASLIRTYSPNQRPLSRYAVAKMVIEARERAEKKRAKNLEYIIEDLEGKFKDDIAIIKKKETKVVKFVPLDKVNLEWTLTNQPEEIIPNNNLGTVTGRVQPLLAYEEGRHYRKYYNVYYDFSTWFHLTPYFAGYGQPEFYSVSEQNDQPFDGGAKFQRLYMKGGYRNFEVEFGRDDLWWGPGYQSLMLSNNARGKDMLKLSTPSTFRLPWVLKYLGQWRFTGFFSWMGTKYQPPNTILSGYRVDYQPLFWLDVGFDHVVFMGGEGAKDPSVKTAIGEYIGFIFDSGNAKASSNHLMGFDMTVKIPPLRGVELYGKVLFEDTNKEFELMYFHNASWLAGVYLPYIDSAGKLSLRAEVIRTGEYAYRHGFYRNGYEINEKMMGYDAGSDTYSGILKANYLFNMSEYAEAMFRYLKRSSNTYRVVLDASGDQSGLAVDGAGTKEEHYLFQVGGQKKLSRMVNIYGGLGLDYVKNKYFRQGEDALDFSLQLRFTFQNL